MDTTANDIVATERTALDRWVAGDPDGYLDLFAPEATYFDPYREKRIDGAAALAALLGPIRNVELPFADTRYEMIDPHVEQYGDMALLTFNLINYGTLPGQPEAVLSRWNATQVYRQIAGQWKIVHSHWSWTKPLVR